jgi:protein arginine kinase activator
VFAEESPDWNLESDASATCEMCGEEPATVHLLKVEGGAVTHTSLCPSCAESVAEENDGLALVLAVPSVLRRLGNSPAPEAAEAKPEAEKDGLCCSVCGTTLSDLKESGLVGCAACYRVFTEYLEVALVSAEEQSEHMGKVPQRGSASDTVRHEMLRLQRMLRELVETERFEEAASVRDKLAELTEKLAESV